MERIEADEQALQGAEAAYKSCVDMFINTLNTSVQLGKPYAQTIKDIEAGASVRVMIDFDQSGPLSFQFYLLKGDEPELLFDACPDRPTN